jgi:hypothetical protein
MTEYYDRQTVNDKHLVSFNIPEQKKLYYYEFDKKDWIECYPLDNLPYNLCSFRLELKKEKKCVIWKTKEKCVVTCKDSYRLSETYQEHTDHKFMLAEKKWRDDIVISGAEFDWYLEKTNEWVKGKVCWTKADIIPGVIVIGPRNCPNINGWGYIYKESKRFAKSCTYTKVFTQEELDEEEKQKQDAVQSINNKEKIVNEWKEKIGMKCPEKYKHLAYRCHGSGKFGIVDTLPYYQSLKRYPLEVTKERIAETLPIEDRQKFLEKEYPTLGLIGLVSKLTDGYSVCFNSNKKVPQHDKYLNKKYVILSESDGFFNIQIHCATFAYLYCCDSSDDNEFNRKIELEKVNIDGKDIFTFTDITYDNPLTPSLSGSKLTIYTDGNLVTYMNIWIDIKERIIIDSFGNSYAISHFPKLGCVLLNGHMWQPSMSLSYDELINIPLPVEKLKMEPIMMMTH